MARKILFKGIDIEELKTWGIEKVAMLLPSRSRRFLKRNAARVNQFLEKLKKKAEVRTHYRDMVILPQMIGRRIKVYNGKEFVDVTIQPYMVGQRLGSLAYTIKKVVHSGPGIGATRGSKAVELK